MHSHNVARLQRLIEDLRSGRSRQATGRLKKILDNEGYRVGFCCLGRACELYRSETARGFWEHTDTGELAFHPTNSVDDDTGSTTVMPRIVADWYGFDNLDPSIPYEDREGNKTYIHLSGLNDSGFTFDQIADMIEYHLLAPEVSSV